MPYGAGYKRLRNEPDCPSAKQEAAEAWQEVVAVGRVKGVEAKGKCPSIAGDLLLYPFPDHLI